MKLSSLLAAGTAALAVASAPAYADLFSYDFTLTATELGAGGVFCIGSLPAAPAIGHITFDVDPVADDINIAAVVGFDLTIGDNSFTLADLSTGLYDFRPGHVGGPMTGSFMIGSKADRSFFYIDTELGWIAGADALAQTCDFGAAGLGCIGGGVGTIAFTPAVPEPASHALLGLGLAGLLMRRRMAR